MNSLIKTECIKVLKRALEDLVNDRCEADDEQMRKIISAVAHRPVSKDVACEEVLHWSRSKFDQLVAMGQMPAGRKRRGWKELVWYEDELLEAKEKLR